MRLLISTLLLIAGLGSIPGSTAQPGVDKLTRLDMSRIAIDLEWVARRLRERQHYILDFFRLNGKTVTGTSEDLATFADLFARVPDDRRSEVMQAIVPLASSEFIEILESGFGRQPLARC